MAISKEVQKSSEMKFDGKLIKVTYDIADVNGNDAWREVVHHPGATAIVVVTEDNKNRDGTSIPLCFTTTFA